MRKRLQELKAIGRPFWLLWIGETISLVGTQLAAFAMGVWIYEQTGSALTLAGSSVAAILPSLLMVPIAGSIVDNLDKRLVMIVADAASAILTLCILLLLLTDSLTIGHLYVFTAISSICSVLQVPAYQASVALMVNAPSLTKASGAMSVSASTMAICTPALAGALLAKIGLVGIVLIDLASFLCGTAFVWRAFWLCRETRVQSTGLRRAIAVSLVGFLASVRFLAQRRLLRLVLLYSVLQAGMFALITILITPLVLAKHSTQDLGLMLSFEAMGSLLGGLLLIFLSPPRKRMLVVLSCDVVIALCIALAGIADSLIAYCVLFATAGFASTLAGSCIYAIWIYNVPSERHGSILVATAAASMACTLLIVLAGGAVVDFVFDPAMAYGGALTSTAGEWIGVGKGRGMALMFVIVGAFSLICTLIGLGSKSLREFH